MKHSYMTSLKLLLTALLLLASSRLSAQDTQLVLNNGKTHSGYIYTQRPGSNMEFVDVKTGKTITVGWAEIKAIKKKLRAEDAKEGLEDEIILSSGESIKCQIIEQIPGVSMTVIKRDRSRRTIDASKVVCTRKIGINKEMTAYEQRTYTNTVILNNGSHKEGLIIEQHTGRTPESNYLILMTELGYKEKILFENISSYHFKPISKH